MYTQTCARQPDTKSWGISHMAIELTNLSVIPEGSRWPCVDFAVPLNSLL